MAGWCPNFSKLERGKPAYKVLHCTTAGGSDDLVLQTVNISQFSIAEYFPPVTSVHMSSCSLTVSCNLVQFQ